MLSHSLRQERTGDAGEHVGTRLFEPNPNAGRGSLQEQSTLRCLPRWIIPIIVGLQFTPFARLISYLPLRLLPTKWGEP